MQTGPSLQWRLNRGRTRTDFSVILAIPTPSYWQWRASGPSRPARNAPGRELPDSLTSQKSARVASAATRTSDWPTPFNPGLV